MKRIYEIPIMRISVFDAENIVASSTGEGLTAVEIMKRQITEDNDTSEIFVFEK